MVVSPSTKLWTYLSLIALAVAWGSVATVVFFEGFDWLLWFLIPSLLVSFVGPWKVRYEVKCDDLLTMEETEKILAWLRTMGPAGLLQLLLYIHFPGKRWAGH